MGNFSQILANVSPYLLLKGNPIQSKNPLKLDLSIPYLSKPMRKAVKFEVVITFQAKTEFCKICNHWLACDFSSGLGLWYRVAIHATVSSTLGGDSIIKDVLLGTLSLFFVGPFFTFTGSAPGNLLFSFWPLKTLPADLRLKLDDYCTKAPKKESDFRGCASPGWWPWKRHLGFIHETTKKGLMMLLAWRWRWKRCLFSRISLEK